MRYFDASPPNQTTVKAFHAFVSLGDLKNVKASGIVDAIHTSFHEIGASDELLTKLVAFGADGASVNQSEFAGAITAIKETYVSWIIYVWCASHRMELSLKDALKGTPSEELDGMMLHIYYLCQKSPNQLRELRE